ncbi:MAG TPA: hypothetical protein VGF30_02195 [Bacteroidia bacterium]
MQTLANEELNEGQHSFTFGQEKPLASGIYLVKLNANGYVNTYKIVVG